MTDISIAQTSAAEQASEVWSEALRQSIREHRHYLVFCGYYALTVWTSLAAAVPESGFLFLSNVGGLAGAVLIPVVFTFTCWMAITLVKAGRANAGDALRQAFRSDFMQPAVLARHLPVLLTLPLVLGTFLSMKVQIARFHPFDYDAYIIHITQRMTGGKLAWEILIGWLGHRWIMAVFNTAYYLWFPILCATFTLRMFSLKRPHLRLQFILTVAACWGLIGSFAALAFSSAGPAFLPKLWGGATPFDGLLQFLQHLQNSGLDLTALQVQDALWRLYVEHSDLSGSGISAMPSVHVTMATVLALYGWRLGRVVGSAYTAFAIIIFFGSIMLAFHYALDGIVGAGAAALIWYVSGRLTDLVHVRHAEPGRIEIRWAPFTRLLRIKAAQ